MTKLRNLHIQSILLGVLVTLVVAAVVNYTNASASPLQQAEGQTVTVTGYVTQYVGDNAIMFTDGTSTVQVQLENVRASELPLNTPLMITATVLDAKDGEFTVELVSVDDAGDDADVSVALPVTTVSEIQAAPTNDSRVDLQGQVTQQIDRDKYLFTDGTGMIVLQISGDVPSGAIPLNQPVTVFGAIDEDGGRVEIDVKGLQPV